ncbi:MAG: putative rane protein [Acidimicrobiales bacterium]|nr:putative rane protein [Acidimicrobiales bacterium]
MGPGWWQASDLKWYPPDQTPGPEPRPGATPPWGAAPETPDWGAPASSGWGTDVSTPGAGAPPPVASPYGASPYGPPPQAGAPFGGQPRAGGPYGGVAGYQGYGAYPAGYVHGSGLPSVQGLATASLVLGIISLVTFFCYGIGFIAAIVGLVLGLVAMSRIKKGQADPASRGQALAGVVCSAITLGIVAVVFVLVLAVTVA